MYHSIRVAAVQMQVTPAPTEERLSRAQGLVTQAAQAGAQLVVLPELFNTGYGYTYTNHDRVESLTGPSVRWMQQTAGRLNIHLAGSLMLLDGKDIYNALMVFAPNGRMWRYDKNYPWALERGFFRKGKGPTVAETALGAFGMMICWDVAHTSLWRQYMGKVDMILVSSCPPDVSNPTYRFPNGDQLTFDDMGSFFTRLKESGTGNRVFGDMINQQTAWLGVPTVNTVACGLFKSEVANGRALWMSLIPMAPRLAKYLSQADRVEMMCKMLQGCKVVDANGKVTAELKQEQGEAFTLAEVALANKKAIPKKPQPHSPLPSFSYFYSDILGPLISIPVYRRGLRRVLRRIDLGR